MNPHLQQILHDITVRITKLEEAQQRTWVGLTADELNVISDSMKTWNSFQITDVYFAIEAKLKDKNL